MVDSSEHGTDWNDNGYRNRNGNHTHAEQKDGSVLKADIRITHSMDLGYLHLQ